MNKKELVELLNIIYFGSDNTNSTYSFDNVDIDELILKVNNKILVALLSVINNFKEEKIDFYRDKKIDSIDLKLTILRAKIAELNNKKNNLRIRLSSASRDYSSFTFEYDFSRMVHDLNIEIIDINKQLGLLQERRKNLKELSSAEIKHQFTSRIKGQNLRFNLQQLNSCNDMPLFDKIKDAVKKSSPSSILELAKKYKILVDERKKNSRINVIPVGEVVDYYPSIKLLSSLELPIQISSYLKSSEECENIIYAISKVQSTTLRSIKQLIEVEYTPEKIDGLRNITSKINNIDISTDYDFLRLHQGKYDNNLAIQLRGYEQIYDSSQKQLFKTDDDLTYINDLRRQIVVLRKKLYGEITSWYLSQKQFNKILDFSVDSLDSYDVLKKRYDKIVEQLNNYKDYIVDALNILSEISAKYNASFRECEREAALLGIDIGLLDDIVSNYYSECMYYIERENVKREISQFINHDHTARTISMTVNNESLAEQLAGNWTANPESSSIELSDEYLSESKIKSA